MSNRTIIEINPDLPAWHGELTRNDWLIDGLPIRSKVSIAKWGLLDWSRAHVDMGPSPAGNPGPYWHVPWKWRDEVLWARLYPKIINTKWLPLIRKAIEEKQAIYAEEDANGEPRSSAMQVGK